MIKTLIRKVLVAVLVASGLTVITANPAVGVNRVCVLGSDYSETTVADSVTVRFTSTAGTCDWTVPSTLTRAEIVVVGGGGSGGFGNQGGGGGGGEVLHNQRVSLTPNSTIEITVGAGGAPAMSSCVGGNISNCPGKNGAISAILIDGESITARGGGGGGGSTPQTQDISRQKHNGASGGSSGGGNRFGISSAPTRSTILAGWTSYVNTGGRGGGNTSGNTGTIFGGGGGGGGAGSAGTSTNAPSATSAVTAGVGGQAIFLAGWCVGGGGSTLAKSGTGVDTLGGASGCSGVSVAPNASGAAGGQSGVANTGGGGGGALFSPGPTGGSGVVIIRYSTSMPSQLITFDSIPTKNFNTPTFSAPATSDAPGETVTVTSSTSSVCTYSGETVTLVSTGTCTLTASQAGSSRVQAAASITRTFQVTKGTPTLGSFSNLSKVYGDNPFALDTVTASVQGSFSFSSLNSSVISVSSRTATIVGAGSASIRLLFTPSDTTKWETATVTGTITVAKKSLTVTAPSHTVEFSSPRSSFSSSMSPTYSGFVSGETESVLDVAPTCIESESYTSTTSPVRSPIAITCSGGVDNNYTFNYSSGNLNVTRKDLSGVPDSDLITADRASISYGEQVTFSMGAISGFTFTPSGSCVRVVSDTSMIAKATAASGVCTGTFILNVGNYETRTVVINIPTTKRQLTVSGSSIANRAYDGSTTAGAVTVGTLGNLVPSETLNLTATASSYATADAGTGKVTTLTYSISSGSGLASNYQAPVSETVTASVLKAPATFNSWPTVTISASSAGESITAPTVTAPLTGGTFAYSIGNTSVASLSGTSIIPVAAGTTSLTATFTPTDTTNYESGSTSATLTISKGTRTISFATTSYSKTYGDSSFSVAATPSAGSSDGSVTYSATGGACSVDSTSGLVRIVSAGSCSISATISMGVNYDHVSTTTPVTVTVAQKTLTVSGTSIASRVYNGTSTPGTLTLGSVSGYVVGESITVSAIAANLSAANAGTYSTNVRYALSNGVNGLATNYQVADESVTAVIQKKVLTITASNGAAVFGGSAPSITANYSGFVASEDASVLDTAPSCTSTYTNTSAAGSYVSTSCSGAADGNYSFAYISGVVTVSANSRTITLSISDVTLQYGETATLTSTISAGGSDGTITYLTSESSICSISGNTVRALASSGTCQISASISAGANYTAVISAYTAITLSKRDLTVINSLVVNKVYDGNDTATVTSAALSGLVGGDVVQLTPHARFNNKAVGNSKPVTAAMSISGRDAVHYQLTQPALSNANITARTITITGLTVLNRNFDSSTVATISGTPVLLGLITGDSVTLTSYSSGTFATMGPGTGISVTTNMALAGSDASNYQLTPPSLSGDIPLILANTITLLPVATKRYGAAPFLVSATASSGLPVQVFARGSACSILGYEITIVSVGVCELSAEQSGDSTYDPAEPVVDSFTVLAAELTITVVNKAIVAGSATPANSYTLTGSLAAGDSISTVNYRYSSPTYTISATAPTAIGNYVLSISGVTLSSGDIRNYVITYVDGIYSIGSASDKNLTGMVVFVPGAPTVDYLYSAFDPMKYTYSVLLPPSATTLRVTIARSSISTFKSQVRINDSGYRTLKYSSTVGGTADSGDLPVSNASNSILILITAPDKTTLTYTINVFKDVVTRDTTTVTSANVDSIVTSRNNEVPTVASSVVTGISFSPTLTLAPTFSLTTYAYNATVPATQSSVIISTSFQGTGFIIKVRANNGGFRAVNNGGKSQPLSLLKGSNLLYVRVESGDGSVVVYTFAVTRL